MRCREGSSESGWESESLFFDLPISRYQSSLE